MNVRIARDQCSGASRKRQLRECLIKRVPAPGRVQTVGNGNNLAVRQVIIEQLLLFFIIQGKF